MECTAVDEVRERWLQAVCTGDAEAISDLVTNDVVVIHPNGRMSSGRDGVVSEFRDYFEHFSVEQSVVVAEVNTDSEWAFDRGDVTTVITPREPGSSKCVKSHVLNLLHRGADGCWRVARTMSVLLST